jgi:hypothetical protein
MKKFKAGHLHPAEAMQECRILVCSVASEISKLTKKKVETDCLLHFFALSLLCFSSGFGHVEGCIKVCICVWARDILTDFLLICQRSEFQVSHSAVLTALSLKLSMV